MGDLLECTTPEQLALLSAVVGIVLADGLSVDEMNSLGNFLMSVGDIIVLIAAQQELLEQCDT